MGPKKKARTAEACPLPTTYTEVNNLSAPQLRKLCEEFYVKQNFSKSARINLL
jgi:hypothetical protein